MRSQARYTEIQSCNQCNGQQVIRAWVTTQSTQKYCKSQIIEFEIIMLPISLLAIHHCVVKENLLMAKSTHEK
jgi:hypothetical protein